MRVGGPQTQRDQEATNCSAPSVVEAESCYGGDGVMHLPQHAHRWREVEGSNHSFL